MILDQPLHPFCAGEGDNPNPLSSHIHPGHGDQAQLLPAPLHCRRWGRTAGRRGAGTLAIMVPWCLRDSSGEGLDSVDATINFAGRSSKLFCSHPWGGKIYFCMAQPYEGGKQGEENASVKLKPWRDLMGSHDSFGKASWGENLQSSNPAAVKLHEAEVVILSCLAVWHGCRDDCKHGGGSG